MPPPIKTKPAPWCFVYSSTITTPWFLATMSVGCCYWILPLTNMHPEDGTLQIFQSLPSCPPQSQYTLAPFPVTHHCPAIPNPVDSGLTVSTTLPCIQRWQVPFESHAPQHPPLPPKNYIWMFPLHMGTPWTTIAPPRHPQALPILAAWMASKPTDITLDSTPPPNWDQELISKKLCRMHSQSSALCFNFAIWSGLHKMSKDAPLVLLQNIL